MGDVIGDVMGDVIGDVMGDVIGDVRNNPVTPSGLGDRKGRPYNPVTPSGLNVAKKDIKTCPVKDIILVETGFYPY